MLRSVTFKCNVVACISAFAILTLGFGCGRAQTVSDSTSRLERHFEGCSNDDQEACEALDEDITSGLRFLLKETRSPDAERRWLAYYKIAELCPQQLSDETLSTRLESERDDLVLARLYQIVAEEDRQALLPIVKEKWSDAGARPLLRYIAYAIVELDPSGEKFLRDSLPQFSEPERSKRVEYIQYAVSRPMERIFKHLDGGEQNNDQNTSK